MKRDDTGVSHHGYPASTKRIPNPIPMVIYPKKTGEVILRQCKNNDLFIFYKTGLYT